MSCIDPFEDSTAAASWLKTYWKSFAASQATSVNLGTFQGFLPSVKARPGKCKVQGLPVLCWEWRERVVWSHDGSWCPSCLTSGEPDSCPTLPVHLASAMFDVQHDTQECRVSCFPRSGADLDVNLCRLLSLIPRCLSLLLARIMARDPLLARP